MLPVFYRLDVHECRRQDLFEREDLGQLALSEGFYRPKRQKEMPTEKALDCLKGLAAFTGIENDSGVLNDSDCTERRIENQTNRMQLIERIVDAVEAHARRIWHERQAGGAPGTKVGIETDVRGAPETEAGEAARCLCCAIA